jgi:hypothetical protein
MAAVIALLLGCTFWLNAQVIPTVTARLTHLSDGTDEVKLRNDSSKSLVAVAVLMAQTTGDGPYLISSDTLIDTLARPIEAGEVRTSLYKNFSARSGAPRIHRLADPVVVAGIFADGTTAGDAGLLARLMLRRSNMLLAVENTLEALSAAGRRNVPGSN